MKKIEAKELSAAMAKIANETSDWTEFVDMVAYYMVDYDYATEDILDLEYMGNDYDYVWAQAENFWKIFKKRGN
jgi:hypothetical protein